MVQRDENEDCSCGPLAICASPSSRWEGAIALCPGRTHVAEGQVVRAAEGPVGGMGTGG